MRHAFSPSMWTSNGLDVPQRAPLAHYASYAAPRLRYLSDLAVRAVGVADAKLRDRVHLSRHPAGKDLAALLLAKTGPGEVALGDEGDDVNDDLMFVEDGIDDDGDDGGKVGLSHDFD